MIRTLSVRRASALAAPLLLALAITAGCDSDSGGGLVQDGAGNLDIVGGDSGAAASDATGGDTGSSGASDVTTGADSGGTSASDSGGTSDTVASSDTAGGGADIPLLDVPGPMDTTDDAPAPMDTTPTQDVPAPMDTAPDAPAPMDVATDTGAPTSCTASPYCPGTQNGPTGIVINMQPANAVAPTLGGLVNGSGLPSGLYDLGQVDIYPQGAFGALQVTLADNGGSNGTAAFTDDAWAFFFDLDLTLTMTGLGTQQAQQAVSGGGCYTVSGNVLTSDASTCASGWPSGTSPPTMGEFEHNAATGTFKLKLVLTKAFILSLVPAEFQTIAGLLITGDLTLIMTLQSSS